MLNFKNNVIFHYKEYDRWKFCGNGIILNEDRIVSAAHIYDKCGPLGISNTTDLGKIYPVEKDNYKYRNFESTLNNLPIDDLMIIENNWFPYDQVNLGNDNFCFRESISIIGFNEEKSDCISSKIIQTKRIPDFNTNIGECKYDKEMQPGISGSPVFDDNNYFIGIFVSEAAKHKLGFFLKSGFITSKL